MLDRSFTLKHSILFSLPRFFLTHKHRYYLTETLVNIFGATEGNALLGLVMHQVVTGHALYRAQDWLEQRDLPADMKNRLIGTGNVYEFMAQIGADMARREAFLKTWIQVHHEMETVLFDTTSISTYSPHLDVAEWGYNRDDEKLEQMNFSLAVQTKSRVPVYYRVIPGSLPDVITIGKECRIHARIRHEHSCHFT